MMKARWHEVILAESEGTVVVEGNHYFPPQSVVREYIRESATRSLCPWKGQAHYYDIVVDGDVNKDAAWSYPDPKEAARNIKDHVAFWKGVAIEE
ncbi:MAG TPA: hypothetical protein DCO77_02525 [Nitrospiraceae bacterium]|nr:hypothetical protein [Nitrospiraceae bacterium]